jgi:Eukaryotic-type carbonic anhydrase
MLVFVNQHGTVGQYRPLQLHVHAPSEHLIDGRQFDLELHVVYKSLDIDGKLSVIGVMFDSHNENSGSSEGDNPFIEGLRAKLFAESLGTEGTAKTQETLVEDLELPLM